jgi:hypothetical protein
MATRYARYNPMVVSVTPGGSSGISCPVCSRLKRNALLVLKSSNSGARVLEGRSFITNSKSPILLNVSKSLTSPSVEGRLPAKVVVVSDALHQIVAQDRNDNRGCR